MATLANTDGRSFGWGLGHMAQRAPMHDRSNPRRSAQSDLPRVMISWYRGSDFNHR